MQWPFSRKPDPVTAELLRQNQALTRDLSDANAKIESLIRTIRGMDQEIYNMGQQADWRSMRPYYNKLQDEMNARKVIESHAINDLLQPVLIETYTPPTEHTSKRFPPHGL